MYLGRRPFKALGREPSYRTSLTNGSKAFSSFPPPIFSTSSEPLSFLSCSKPNPTGSTDLSAIPFYQHPMVTWTEHRGFFCVGNISFPSSHHHRNLHFCIQAINQHTILSISECWDRWWVKSSIDIILWMSKRKIRCVRHRAGWRLKIDFFHFVYFIEITFGNFRFPVSVD